MEKYTAYKRGYCMCCGVQRDETGIMTHDFECIWYGYQDIKALNKVTNERIEIFTPYTPK